MRCALKMAWGGYTDIILVSGGHDEHEAEDEVRYQRHPKRPGKEPGQNCINGVVSWTVAQRVTGSSVRVVEILLQGLSIDGGDEEDGQRDDGPSDTNADGSPLWVEADHAHGDLPHLDLGHGTVFVTFSQHLAVKQWNAVSGDGLVAVGREFIWKELHS